MKCNDLRTTDSRREVKRNVYSVQEGKLAGKRQLERPRSRRVTYGRMAWTEFIDWAGTRADSI